MDEDDYNEIYGFHKSHLAVYSYTFYYQPQRCHNNEDGTQNKKNHFNYPHTEIKTKQNNKTKKNNKCSA